MMSSQLMVPVVTAEDGMLQGKQARDDITLTSAIHLNAVGVFLH